MIQDDAYERYLYFTDTQRDVAQRNECLMEMFCPPNGCMEQEVKAKLSRLHMMVEKLTVMAAQKILFLTVDFRVLKFLLDRRFEAILLALYESVIVVSLLLKSSKLLVEFLKNMRKNGKKFERICIYGIKKTDLFFLDEILSLCSGVAEYGTTHQGQKDKEALRQMMVTDEYVEFCEFDQRIPQDYLLPLDQTR